MALAREQITIVDLHDGVDGSTYSLNILGGTRTISYNATGKSPTPAQAAYSCELYKDGVKVTPSSYAWSASGHLSGTSTAAGFTPTALQTYSASLTSSNVVSLTVAYGGMVFKGTVQVVVTKAATDAKLITLVADSQVFKVVGKTVSPATAKITAETQNTSVTAWTYSSNGAAFTSTLPAGVARSGSTVTITGASMTAQTIAVKASDGTYSDVMTIVKVADGKEGKSGAPAVQPVTGFLTNESVTFPADFEGKVTGHTGPVGSFKVFQGTTDVTASASFTASNNVGGTVTISSTGVYTLNSLTADRASVDLKAVYGGVSIIKTLTISKSRAGTPGPVGRAVDKIDVMYYSSTSPTTQENGSWSTSAPAWVNGRFIWSKTVTTYTEGTPPTTSSLPILLTGATGNTGRGIKSITEQYALTSNKNTAPSQGSSLWKDAAPTWTSGSYMWTRSKIVYLNSDGSETTTYAGVSVDTAWEAVNEIEVGGRNYILNSHFDKNNFNGWSSTYGTQVIENSIYKKTFTSVSSAARIEKSFKLNELGVFTFSIFASIPQDIQWRTFVGLGSVQITQEKVEGYSVYSVTFENTTSGDKIIRGYLPNVPIGSEVLIDWEKLEKGNIATDWTPAPEDIEERLVSHDARIDTNEREIALRATTAAVGSIDTRLKAAELKVTADAITSTVRKSTDYINDQGKKVSTNEIISKINQSAEKITIEASKVNINGAVTFSSFDTALQDSLATKDNVSTAETNAKTHAEVVSSVFGSGDTKTFTRLTVASQSNNAPNTLIIRTPITFTARMCQVFFSGYNYSGNDLIEGTVGFYAYNTSSWFVNTGYTSKGKTRVSSVRLASDSSNRVVIIITFVGATLSYPKISIDKAVIGFTTPPDSWREGWSASFSTDLSGLTVRNTPKGKDYDETYGLTKAWQFPDTTEINGGSIRTKTITAAQIKAKTITASEIAANTITVNQLASSVGSSLDLSSNKAITARVTSTQLSTALNGKEDSIFKQSSAPAHKVGRLWLDTSTDPNQLKRSDGTKWVIVNDVQVGGRNLLLDTSRHEKTVLFSRRGTITETGYNKFTYQNQTNANSGPIILLSRELVSGENYTLSFNVHSNIDTSMDYIATRNNTTQTHIGVLNRRFPSQSISEGNNRIELQFAGSGENGIWIALNTSNQVILELSNIKLEKGNIATDWTPAPEDIQAEMDTISGEIGDVSGALTTLDGHVKGAFHDGIIDEAEARAIEKYLNIVNSEKADVDAKYTKLYTNSLLAGTAKTGLYSVKSTYNTAHTNLISAINTAIRGGKASNAEKTNVDAKFTAYRTALTNLSTAFETASAYLVSAVNGRFDGPTGVITRLNEAESKVTDDAIIGTVSQKTTSDGKPLFAKTSQIKQAVDTWTATFSQIGGSNMLIATNLPRSFTRYGGTVSYPSNGSVRVQSATNSGSAAFGIQTHDSYRVAKLKTGEKYTLSFLVRGLKDPNYVYAMYTGQANQSIHSYRKDNNPLSATEFTKRIYTFTAGENADLATNAYPMISYTGSITTNDWFEVKDVQLEQGAVATDWTPHPDELYTGVTKIDKDGVTVSRSDSDIKTEVTYSGTKISDDHGTIANFGETTHMPFANIDEVQSDDVVGTVFNPDHVHGNYEYEIGKGRTFTTISEALDAIFSGGSRRFLVNDTNIRLYINGTIEDKVLLRGIAGNGRIYIFFRTGAKLYGSIWARDCMNRIYIRSSTTTGTGRGMIIADNPDKGYAVFNEASKHVHLISMDINAKLKTAAVQGNDTGTTILDSCDVVGGTYGTWCRYSHTLRAVNCRGNATHGHYADQLGIQLIGGTTCTNGSSANINQSSPTGGLSLKAGTPSGTSSAFSPPPTSDKEFTQTFRAISLRTKTSTGEWQTYYGSTAAQNRWASTSPYSVGQITFSSDVYSFIKDRKTGTTPTIRIRMRRKNTSHGASAAIKPDPANFSSTAFSSVSGAVQGGWTGWGKLTVSNFSTSGNTLLTIGTGKTDVNYNPYRYYAIWDIAEVEVTKIKNV